MKTSYWCRHFGLSLCLISLTFGYLPPASNAEVAKKTQAQTGSTNDVATLVAPFALYPDDVLIMVLDSALVPQQVSQAGKQLNAAKKAPAASWPDSVKALYVEHPNVLGMMAQNLAMTTRLGIAYENNPDQVWQEVIKARQSAKAAGTSVKQTAVNADVEVVEAQPATSNTYNTYNTYNSDTDSSSSTDPALAGLAGLGVGMALGAAMNDDDDDVYYYGAYGPPVYYHGDYDDYYGGYYGGAPGYKATREYNTARGSVERTVERAPGYAGVSTERNWDTARSSGAVERSKSWDNGTYNSHKDVERNTANWETDRSRSVTAEGGQATVSRNMDVYNKNTGQSKSFSNERTYGTGSYSKYGSGTSAQRSAVQENRLAGSGTARTSWGPYGSSASTSSSARASAQSKYAQSGRSISNSSYGSKASSSSFGSRSSGMSASRGSMSASRGSFGGGRSGGGGRRR